MGSDSTKARKKLARGQRGTWQDQHSVACLNLAGFEGERLQTRKMIHLATLEISLRIKLFLLGFVIAGGASYMKDTLWRSAAVVGLNRREVRLSF